MMWILQSVRRLTPYLGLVLTAAIMVSTPVEARIYKWKDEDGNVIYSQSPPPPGTGAERIKEARPPADDPEALKDSLRERTEGFEERRNDRRESEEDSEAARQRAEQQKKICDQLRKNLQVLQTSNQVREQGDDGEYAVLAEEQRQAKIAATRERIEEECSD